MDKGVIAICIAAAFDSLRVYDRKYFLSCILYLINQFCSREIGNERLFRSKGIPHVLFSCVTKVGGVMAGVDGVGVVVGAAVVVVAAADVVVVYGAGVVVVGWEVGAEVVVVF